MKYYYDIELGHFNILTKKAVSKNSTGRHFYLYIKISKLLRSKERMFERQSFFNQFRPTLYSDGYWVW